MFDPARSSSLAGKTLYKQLNNTLNYLHSLRQHYKLLSLLLRVVNSVSRDSFALNAPRSDLNSPRDLCCKHPAPQRFVNCILFIRIETWSTHRSLSAPGGNIVAARQRREPWVFSKHASSSLTYLPSSPLRKSYNRVVSSISVSSDSSSIDLPSLFLHPLSQLS